MRAIKISFSARHRVSFSSLSILEASDADLIFLESQKQLQNVSQEKEREFSDVLMQQYAEIDDIVKREKIAAMELKNEIKSMA